MSTFFTQLFESTFMPHGHCYLWQPDILWLHVGSDAAIALAYYSIPAALWYFVRKRRDLNTLQLNWIFILFGAFIFACGTTHLIDIWTTWQATYRLEGVVKLLTAVISLSTAVLLWPLIPKALALPSPAQLAASNQALAREVENRGRAEAEVRELNRDLERRVQARTHELEVSNAELERFAYVASHDLRSPLHAIESLAAWLEEDLDAVLDPPSREKMALLRGRVGRMEALLDGLLAYSRAGHLKSEITTVDVGRLVAETAELLGPPAGFRVETRGEMPVFPTLEVPLRQVLRNLLDNAFKHHDRATGRVVVAVHELDDRYELSVSDDGPGIPAAFHEQIYDVFRTLKPRDEVEGSGMGLAIVKKVVETGGGTIAVTSEGRGTTFRFTWPKIWPRSTP